MSQDHARHAKEDKKLRKQYAGWRYPANENGLKWIENFK